MQRNLLSQQEEASRTADDARQLRVCTGQKCAAATSDLPLLLCFTDLTGHLRGKLVPVCALPALYQRGGKFSAFDIFDCDVASPCDLTARPDGSTLITELPWKPGYAWVLSDLELDDNKFPQCPRLCLKNQLEIASKLGYTVMTGIEPEFFLLSDLKKSKANSTESTVQLSLSDERDTAAESVYDLAAVSRNIEFLSKLLYALDHLGWKPYQVDHEHTNGQYEINMDFTHCLLTADRHVFIKYMCKELAEEAGVRCTFMPKPFAGRPGNGAHMHVSLWSADTSSGEGPPAGTATNLFLPHHLPHDTAGTLLSDAGRYFVGGVLHHARAIAAFACPTVNSYKRLRMRKADGQWVSKMVSYGRDNRTHIVRIPKPGVVEVRFPDGAAHPYLLPASVIAAGLHGIRDKIDPGEPRTSHAVREHDPSVAQLPESLLDAIHCLESDQYLVNQLGHTLVAGYCKLKRAEWHRYTAHLSRWEIDNYINC